MLGSFAIRVIFYLRIYLRVYTTEILYLFEKTTQKN